MAGGRGATSSLFVIGRRFSVLILSLGLVLSGWGCATRGGLAVDQLIENDGLSAAIKELESDTKISTRLDRMLMLGHLYHLDGQHARADSILLQCDDLFRSSETMNISSEVAALVVDEAKRQYQPYDFEESLLRCYRTYNALEAGDRDNAIIEARGAVQLISDRKNMAVEGEDPQSKLLARIAAPVLTAAGEDNDAGVALRAADMRGPTNGVLLVECGRAPVLESIKIALPILEPEKERAKKVGTGKKATDAEAEKRLRVRAEDYVKTYAGNVYSYEYSSLEGMLNRFGKKDQGNDSGGLSLKSGLVFSFPRITGDGTRAVRCEVLRADRLISVATPTLDIDAAMREEFTARIPAALLRAVARALVTYKLVDVSSSVSEVLGAGTLVAKAILENADTRSWQTLPAWIAVAELPDGVAGETLTIRILDDNGGVVDEQQVVLSDLGTGVPTAVARCPH